MKKYYIFFALILLNNLANGQFLNYNSLYFENQGVVQEFFNFTKTSYIEFETFSTTPDQTALSDGRSCQQMRNDHGPQGFLVYCGPSEVRHTGTGWRVTCANTSNSFCAMVHEDLFPKD